MNFFITSDILSEIHFYVINGIKLNELMNVHATDGITNEKLPCFNMMELIKFSMVIV